jgi:phospholipase/carboxylesterase
MCLQVSTQPLRRYSEARHFRQGSTHGHPRTATPLNGYVRPAQAAPELAAGAMHGVGSNAQDLFSLAPYVPPQFHAQPAGAVRHGAGCSPGSSSVNPDGSRTIAADQEQHSRALVAQTVQQAAEQLGVPPERVVVAASARAAS